MSQTPAFDRTELFCPGARGKITQKHITAKVHVKEKMTTCSGEGYMDE